MAGGRHSRFFAKLALMEPDEQLVSLPDAAKQLGVGSRTLANWWRIGEVQPVPGPFGTEELFIPKADVERLRRML